MSAEFAKSSPTFISFEPKITKIQPAISWSTTPNSHKTTQPQTLMNPALFCLKRTILLKMDTLNTHHQPPRSQILQNWRNRQFWHFRLGFINNPKILKMTFSSKLTNFDQNHSNFNNFHEMTKFTCTTQFSSTISWLTLNP